MVRSLYISNSKRDMKKKIYFVAIILFIVFGFDIMIGAVSKQAIKSVNDVGLNQTNTAQALFKRKADVLILGSSRANHSFVCSILEKELGLSCYNAGRDGMNIMYDGMIFFSYLQRYRPKMLVLDIGGSMLDSSWNETWKEMICFYGMAAPLDQIIDSIASNIQKIQLQSSIYRYNKSWEWILKASFSKDMSDLNGYRPLPVQVDHPKTPQITKGSFKEDNGNVEMLSRIIDECKKYNIKVVLTYTPSLSIDHGNFAFFLSQYGRKKDVLVLDWNGDEKFTTHPEWFYDMGHLNSDGAIAFTYDFISRLRENKEGM